MGNIELLYVENVITRKNGVVLQNLVFSMQLRNLDYHKQVDVVWAGEDGLWHALAAHYHGMAGAGMERWQASAAFELSANQSLPGNIQFGLRYQVSGEEYWDNNQGVNFSSQADSGIMLAHGIALLNVAHDAVLDDRQRIVPVTVAAQGLRNPGKVTIHWSADNWKTRHQSPCHFKRDQWDSELQSNARNPNHYGCQVWKGFIRADTATQLQYSVSCEAAGQMLWDNNHGQNYLMRRKPLKVLILNLHCYQEEEQDRKFSVIAQAIGDLDVDVVCLQEVAELWNDGKGDWATNSARIINERLATPYHLASDWSHIGFDKYREGVAVLSRYPVARHKSQYVSASDDPYSIHSRKVVMAQIRVPRIGLINVFSSHLSWWDDGFPDQFEALMQWAREENSSHVRATMLCGDFNIEAGSRGYERVVESNEYEDQYLAADAPALFGKIFRDRAKNWPRLLEKDGRIDYVFLNKSSDLRAVSAATLFTEQDYGRVSDHCGYLLTFEPK